MTNGTELKETKSILSKGKCPNCESEFICNNCGVCGQCGENVDDFIEQMENDLE